MADDDPGPRGKEYHGLEVAITGRLASMTRGEAWDHLRAAGAEPVRGPGPMTAVLVVGQDGWPLREDGRPTRSLERARELQRDGSALRIVVEERWLVELGLDDRQGAVRRLCTSSELGRILGVPMSRIRSWSRVGLIRPARTVHRLEFFEFRQVAAARALADLVEHGVSLERIRAGLDRVRAWLPGAGDTLASRAILEREGELLVRLEGGAIADPSGQLRLDFEFAEQSAPAELLRSPRQWYEEGQRREDSGELEEATRAYQEAVRGESRLPEAHFNLANVLYLLEHPAEAAAEYLRAVEIDPEYVEAWNNLGNVLAEVGEVASSLQAYTRAIEIAPEYGDAHFNLGETLWGEGRFEEARVHYRFYLRQDPTSPWARQIRERLV